MKQTNINKINPKNVLDIMYEPDNYRCSILEYNGTRKEISLDTYIYLLETLEKRFKNKI